jgi:solute carrier family 6 GABA transporter-like protein 1
MREIAPLSTLVLRCVGPSTCNPELTFGGPREAESDKSDCNGKEKDKASSADEDNAEIVIKCPPPPDQPTLTSRLLRSLRDVKRPRLPYKGAARPNANDVDLSHPWILALEPSASENILCIEHGNHALDTLQLFIDALVDSGRASDTRLGVHSFREWVIAVIGQEAANEVFNDADEKKTPKKKRKITSASLPTGSLSLHNMAAASYNTFKSMELANVGVCLSVLDLTGVHGLTDSILSDILCAGSFPHIERLSLKNCRKITGEGLASVVNFTKLTALDIGGCFNVKPYDVLSMVQAHPGTQKATLTEIYAGGLGWTDVDLELLIESTAGHLRGLGVGFSPYVSGPGLILTMSKVAETLERLAVPFCDSMDDAAASALGKNLNKLNVLDIRGSKVTTLTGLMDGRYASGIITPLDDAGLAEASQGKVTGHLFVLARYSGISKSSLEETMKFHQNTVFLTCVLDGAGTGEGIRRHAVEYQMQECYHLE